MEMGWWVTVVKQKHEANAMIVHIWRCSYTTELLSRSSAMPECQLLRRARYINGQLQFGLVKIRVQKIFMYMYKIRQANEIFCKLLIVWDDSEGLWMMKKYY
jgi:hypothetical protein